MREIILDFIKSCGVRSILRKDESKGLISTMLIDFLGTDGKYYSFFISYNTTQVFSKRDSKLIECKSAVSGLSDKLSDSLLVFNSKNAYLDGKWKIIPSKIVFDQLHKYLQLIENRLFESKQCGDFTIIKIATEMRLFCGVIVYYKYKEVNQDPIVYRYSSTNYVKLNIASEECRDLIALFDCAGLNDIIWECV